MQKLRDGFLWLNDALASVMLVVLTALTFIDVVGRNLFHRPLMGSNELTEYSLVFVTFFAYSVVAWKRQHIVVDILDSFSPAWLLHAQKIFGDVLGAGLFGMLAQRLWAQGTRLATYGDMTPQLSIPVFYAYYFMAVMSAITAAAFILSAFARRRDESDAKAIQDEVV